MRERRIHPNGMDEEIAVAFALLVSIVRVTHHEGFRPRCESDGPHGKHGQVGPDGNFTQRGLLPVHAEKEGRHGRPLEIGPARFDRDPVEPMQRIGQLERGIALGIKRGDRIGIIGIEARGQRAFPCGS